MKTLVFATHNAHKFKEVLRMLPEGLELKSLSDIGCTDPIPETGTTLVENARIKAEYVRSRYGLDCFADDTGLEVTALNGAPGVYSARYAGANANAAKNMQKLLRALEGQRDRSAQFRTVIALATSESLHYFEGRVEGRITEAPSGDAGFGYDPIFQPSGSERTFAAFDPEEKNAISHRGRAFEALCRYLASPQDRPTS